MGETEAEGNVVTTSLLTMSGEFNEGLGDPSANSCCPGKKFEDNLLLVATASAVSAQPGEIRQ